MKQFVLILFISCVFAHPTVHQSDEHDSKIIGGEQVKDGGAPYQISLQLRPSGDHFCGGSIIADQWILTAAHCVYGVSASQLQIRYNSLHHSNGGSTMTITKVIAHENYSAKTFDNDIALLKLTEKINVNQTNSKVVKVAYPDYDPTMTTTVMVSGWGNTKEDVDSIPKHLMYVNVQVVERNQCAYLLRKYGPVTRNMFCAGDVKLGNKDACQGDSGGPVVQGDQLVGVVSWGIGCGRPNLPGIYTRVGNYNKWIKSKMAHN